MKVSTRTFHKILSVKTSEPYEFVDLTEAIEDFVKDSGVKNGFCVVYSKHTTAAVRINESEPLLIEDMKEFLEDIAPRNGDYKHNDFNVRTVNMTEDECPNGHAHCQHLTLDTSETIPIINSELQFGTWQRVFLIELDRPRDREVVLQIVGGG